MPLRHIVMWTLNDVTDAQRFKAELDSCAELVPGILAFRAVLPEPGCEANVDVLLDSTFTDAAALEAYQNHPHHQDVAKRLGTMRRSRHVLDYTDAAE